MTSLSYSIIVVEMQNRLKEYRRNAGLSQQELARQAGVSRQAYAAAESGRATPSTEVALRLARALGGTVDLLFSLDEDPPQTMRADLVGDAASQGVETGGSNSPRRARLWRVGTRLLARPVSGAAAAQYSLADAEGIIRRPSEGEHQAEGGHQVEVQPFDADELEVPALGMLGCDPAVALLDRGLRRYGVRLVSAEEGSYKALIGLARGEVHVAGCHLKDEATGDYNHGWVRRLVPFGCTLVTFAAWQQGLILRPGNPKGIRGVEDLANPEVTLINREAGSGGRSLLDRLLLQRSIPSAAVAGYGREARGHLAVASAVAAGVADAGIGVQAAASALGLGFLPLEEERYDLVIPGHLINDPGVQALLDLLRRPGLRRRVEALGGYDVSSMGLPAV